MHLYHPVKVQVLSFESPDKPVTLSEHLLLGLFYR